MFKIYMKPVLYVLLLFISSPLFSQDETEITVHLKSLLLNSRYVQIEDSAAMPEYKDNEVFLNRVGEEIIRKATEIINRNPGWEHINNVRFVRLQGYLILYAATNESSEIALLKALPDAEILANSNAYPILIETDMGESFTIEQDLFLNGTIESLYRDLGKRAFNKNKLDLGIGYFKMIANNDLMNEKNRCNAIVKIIPVIINSGTNLPFEPKMPEYFYVLAKGLNNSLGDEEVSSIIEKFKPFSSRVQDLSEALLLYINQNWRDGSKNSIGTLNGNIDFGNNAYLLGSLLNRQEFKSDITIWDFFQLAIHNNTIYKSSILDYCITKLNPPYFNVSGETIDDKAFAIDMRNQGLQLISTVIAENEFPGCNFLLDISKKYHLLGDEKNAEIYKKKAHDCLKEKAARSRQKARDERVHHPIQRMYLGFNPLILINKNIGLQLDLRSDNLMHSFGVTFVQKRLDYSAKIFDGEDASWKGFRVNYALKIPNRYEQQFYHGFQLGLSSKSYMMGSIPVYVNGGTVNYDFKPTELQIDLIYVFGVQSLGIILGTDASIGIGVSYNRFDGGNEVWGKEGYKIQSNLLTTRKAVSFYPVLKATWTVGFHLHKKGSYMSYD